MRASTMLRSHACRMFRCNIMLAPNMLRIFTVLALMLCVAVPARAQFWGAPLSPAPAAKPPAQTPALTPAKPPSAPAALPGQPPSPPQPPAQERAAPYDPDMQRLSEILGALHFLRGICDTNEGQKWRNEAQALIDAEAPTGDRHDQMIASFNRGYRGFQQSYRACTPAANVAIRRYLEEGAKIARDITARYAN
jgi:uncharacterized protein (TIGR02301 family)